MASNGFRVQASSLKTGAEQLNELNGRFKNILEEIQNAVKSLSSQWEGEAKDKFDTSMQTDITKMGEFYKLIIQYIEALNNISTEYGNTENNNVNLISA